MNKMGQLFANNGPFVSSQHWSNADRDDTEIFFHHSQKAECMLTACTSWYGGDFMEFGSHDLNTMRDFLTAYDICGMTRAYPDVQFWGFDIFGKLDKDIGDHAKYFEPSSNKTVLEWIFDAMALNSYIYMDEGLQSPEVLAMWREFAVALSLKRNIGVTYIRNAAGFGSLWRLYPIIEASLNI